MFENDRCCQEATQNMSAQANMEMPGFAMNMSYDNYMGGMPSCCQMPSCAPMMCPPVYECPQERVCHRTINYEVPQV